MRDPFPLIGLLPGLLGAVVGYVIGDALGTNSAYAHAASLAGYFRVAGALIGFPVGLAFVALMHWGSRLSAKKPPPLPVSPAVHDESIWPPPPKIG